MDFVNVIDNVDQEEQVDDIGFIENNTFYNTANIQAQNKRLSQLPLPKQQYVYNTNTNPGVKKEPKKVTYDDILSSLNMKVVNGKLQIVRGDVIEPTVSSMSQKTSLYSEQRAPYHKNMVHTTNTYTNTKQSEFYNKFLQAQQQPPHINPLTDQEKKRLLMIQYIKHQQQKQHISKVKSKKLNFV
jgi:hypothetical protein